MKEVNFYVRDIPIHGDLILAPMDGVSDMPFRSTARDLGSAMSYTEYISAIDFLCDDPRLKRVLTYTESERPLVYQVYDSDPERILQAALKLEQLGPDIIDVNMGCPAKTVSNRGAGVGLMREPKKIERIFRLLTHALSVPVTGKIRLGWDQSTRNYLEIARIVEENGGSLLAVHGRTKDQRYSGAADWDAIGEVKQALSIPVIGNGDVQSVADINRMKEHTRCDGVMIGRAAIRNPWLFSRLDRQSVSMEAVLKTTETQLKRSIDYYGEERGLTLFRKFAIRYLNVDGMITREERTELLTTIYADHFLELFKTLLERSDLAQPA